jgi:hypothetical protein
MRMMNVAALTLGIWIVFVPQTSGQPGQRITPKKQAPSGHLAQNPSNGEQPSNAAELKAIADAIAKYEQETAKAQSEETPFEKESIKIQWFLLWIGIAQAIALIGTLGAIIWQSRETARSAKASEESASATRKSVELQEVLNRQWVEIENHDARESYRFGIKGREDSVKVSFSIVNNTKMPFTLRSIRSQIGKDHFQSVQMGDAGHVLAPEGGDYPSDFLFPLNQSQLESYRKLDLILVVTVWVEYIDAFEKPREECHGFMLKCGAPAYNEVHPHPGLPHEKNKQRPN